MAFHILITTGNAEDRLLLDRYLGSAVTVGIYWECIGRKLGLNFISSITERTDSEDGFVLSGPALVEFRSELKLFEEYWISESKDKAIPDNLLEDIREIIGGVDSAIPQGLTLMIG